jgi:hypothetical protein
MTGDHVIHWRAAQWTKSGIVGQWRITSVHFPKSPSTGHKPALRHVCHLPRGCTTSRNGATIFAAVIEFVILIGVLLVGLVLVAHGTAVKNKWGVNLEPVHCPRCNAPQPSVRKPHSFSEMLWGGWRCRSCDCEIDKWKWGRQIH